jgi:hypothetical protein
MSGIENEMEPGEKQDPFAKYQVLRPACFDSDS